MSASSVGILGGGQLGSLLAVAAKKLNIRTSVYSDDKFAPAVNFSDMFFYGKYNDEEKIKDKIQLESEIEEIKADSTANTNDN